MTYAVEFNNVSRLYGDVRAVDGVTIAIRDGEFFSMLGPSGSGKTTCLRLMAGFEQPDLGVVRLGGIDAVIRLQPGGELGGQLGQLNRLHLQSRVADLLRPLAPLVFGLVLDLELKNPVSRIGLRGRPEVVARLNLAGVCGGVSHGLRPAPPPYSRSWRR